MQNLLIQAQEAVQNHRYAQAIEFYLQALKQPRLYATITGFYRYRIAHFSLRFNYFCRYCCSTFIHWDKKRGYYCLMYLIGDGY